MSRSVKKSPYSWWTTCKSEKTDKRIWHGRSRTHERIMRNSLLPEDLDTGLPDKKQVSNVWCMGKDGHFYWPHKRRAILAKRFAAKQGHSKQERAALEKRMLHKWMAK